MSDAGQNSRGAYPAQRALLWLLIFAVGFWFAHAAIDALLLAGTSFADSLLFQIPANGVALRLAAWGALGSIAILLRCPRPAAPEPATTALAHFEQLYQGATVALYRSALDGSRLLEGNQRAAELFGYASRKELIEQFRPARQYADDAQRRELVARLKRTGNVHGFEIAIRRRDGSLIWVRLDAQLVPELEAIEGMALDITREREALALLHDSEQLHRAVIEQSPLGISVRDRTGRLLMCNKAWQAVWAMSDEDVQDDLNRPREQLVFDRREDYLGQRSQAVKRVYLHGGTAYLPECKTSQRRPGSAEWVSQYFYAITGEDGRVDRVVIITEDITDKKRLAEEREELIAGLKEKVEQVQQLSRLIPICASCKKVRDDSGYWQGVDEFLHKHSPAELTHGICPECERKLYPELQDSDGETGGG